MKTISLFFFAISLLGCATSHKKEHWSPRASSGPTYKYNELMIKDYDEMLAMVQSLVNKAKVAAGEDGTANEDEVIGYLRDALKITFSRPDSDNMVAKLVPESRRMLLGFNNAYEGSVAILVDDALVAVKSDNAPASIQSTSLVILENIMGEISPEVGNNLHLRKTMERVRDAHIEISDEVKRERKLRGMFETKNPSDMARNVLKKFEPDKSKKKKK
jgi:hypothetical protein